jgi:DNA mismatch repair protein MutL
MLNDIIILPEDLVDKIAAGEVVERPASVVKELVENSIDAGAKNISVEIKNGGIKFIRVTDDGIGMDEKNSVLAFQRHATSKIKTVDDLFQIATLGFRGEALPSIASVSLLDMLTRTSEELNGTRLKIECGVLKETKPMGASLGTSVLVRELFYNVPARRKFLKTILTETRHIIDLLTRFAIAYPEIAFKLKSDERELFNFPAVSELRQRRTDIFGKDRAEKMIVIKAEDEIQDSGNSQQINGLNRIESADIRGFLGKPEICPSNRAELYLFVNRRPITSKSLYHAVQSGYGELLPKGKFPFAIIFIDIDPSLVDVNVHPTKSEVRFSDERGVHDSVYAKIKESLTSPLTIPEFGSCGPEIKTKGENTQPFQPSVSMQPISPYQEQKPLTQKSEPAESSTFTPPKTDEEKLTQKSLFAETREELTRESRISKLESQAPSHKPQVSTLETGRANLWQLADTYILSFLKGNLMVLDQHAAHERILYEEALRNLTKKQASSQQFLFPTVSDLTPAEFHILEEHKELIQKLGFEIKYFGGRTILVTAVPALVKNKSGEVFLKEILGQLQEEEKVEKDRVKAVAKSFACHAAIKAGDRLNQEEMDNLVRQLFATEEPYSCPHGRPTIIKLSLDELNKKFGRS